MIYGILLFQTCHSAETQAKPIIEALELLSIHDCYCWALLGSVHRRWFVNTTKVSCVVSLMLKAGCTKKASSYPRLLQIHIPELSTNEFWTGWKRRGFSKRFPMAWGLWSGCWYLSSVRRCEPEVLGQTASEIWATCDQISVAWFGWGQIFESMHT